jgi:hypothetical protein
VDDGDDRQFEILIPLTESTGSSWVQMIVFGYGVANAGQVEVLASTVNARVAVSNDATLESQTLRDQLTADPAGTGSAHLAITADALTDDWRAYTGLSVLWLSVDEWKQARASIRRALTEWVASGGKLFLVEPGDVPSAAPIERRGMGMIVTIPEGLRAEDASRFKLATPRAANASDSITWASSLIEPIQTHKGLLSLVLLGYLVLAGPVNLLVLSPGSKRVRLFWTMPAIALGASTLMAVVIVLQDGLGGSGYRANLVYLQPELNRELVLQEQVSKTGALLRRSFEIEEPVVMKSVATAYQPYQQPSRVVSGGSDYAGDWFKSRSIQAQSLVSARSSRARIELVDAHASTPTILSSIDVALEKLYYRDELGRVWYGENVLPGRPLALSASTAKAYEQFYYEASYTTAGPVIRARAAAVRELPGAFLAVTSDDVGIAIDTLSGIDWKDGPVLYAGHITEITGASR